MVIKLLTSALINAVLAVLLYYCDKHTSLGKLDYKVKQVLYGICFGMLAIYSSTNAGGFDVNGVILNVRDAAPLCAGLIFGGPAGIIAGLIGGVYRYVATIFGLAGAYTQIACSVSTILTGFIAAVLRKHMFDNKIPALIYGIGIAAVCEIMHMLMIFLTNMSDPATAFGVVRAASMPMILCNVVAVGIAVLGVRTAAKEKVRIEIGKRYIASTFQLWLFVCIAIAFITTSIFTSTVQSRISESESTSIIQTNIDDVYQDIMDASDANLLDKTQDIKEEYLQGADLDILAAKYNVIEVNIIDEKGIICDTNNEEYIGYEMASGEQSAEFMVLLEGDETQYVQEYRPTSYDNKTFRKYGAVTLEDGGFLQVGYDSNQFKDDVNGLVGKLAKNRHIGKEGFMLICDEELNIVTEGLPNTGENIETLGISISKGNFEENEIFRTEFDGMSYLCTYRFVEGYYIIGYMPVDEAMYLKEVSVHINLFVELIIFASLFVLIYFLIKRIILDNLMKINGTLSEITNGNLNVKVDVRSNEEFASLSDDINSTVNTLKDYIAEAAARIDKELEFAKQIQYSSLPAAAPRRAEFELHAGMYTAKEVGGDFYDYYMLGDSRIAFLVADVSGKGIPAAMFMMRAKTTIKDLAEQGLEPDEIFTLANEKLCENNDAAMFVTAWLGIVDLETGLMKFANAGHNPPLLCRHGQKFEYMKERSGFILAGMEGVKYRRNELQFEPGDRIYLYTDGVTEATDSNEQLYGEDRLLAVLNKFDGNSPQQICEAVKKDVDEFVGEAPQFDDITMLGLTFHAALSENKVKVVADESSRPAVDEFIESIIDKLEIVPKVANKINIIFDEIYSNILFYSKATSAELSYKIEKGSLYLKFEDNGIEYNPLAADEPDITLDAEERQIGGLGVFMVKKMSKNIGYRYEDGRNILELEVALVE